MSFNVEGMDKFADSINKAKSIVITAHLYPDYDAVCSAILLARTLRFNYPKKQVQVVLEDKAKKGVIDDESREVAVMPIVESLRHYKADRLIVVDTNRFDKVTRGKKTELLSYITQNGIETIVVDHHELDGGDEFAVRIQEPALPAATQLVYQLCFHGLAMQRPRDISHIAMLGIVDDSGFFAYTYDYTDTFSIIAELIQDRASVEEAALIVNQVTIEQVAVIAELAKNMKVENGYAYSYISDAFIQARLPLNNPSDFKAACTMFSNKYITAVSGTDWGFIVYPNVFNETIRDYRVSFRSQKDSKTDIRAVTSYLGSGGGHNHAAGANVRAASSPEALLKVKKAILASR